MELTSTRNRQKRRACDRCYELKERCARVPSTGACRRCVRLDQICSTIRPIRPPGRRPHRGDAPLTEDLECQPEISVSSPYNVSSWLADTPELSSSEKDLLMRLLSQPQILKQYVVSSSFQDAEQRSLAEPLPSALPTLKDAYLAYASILKPVHPTCAIRADTSAGLRHASSAIMTLRTFSVINLQDATLCLTLGTALALFVYSAVGVGVSDICSHCLITTQPFIDTEVLDSKAQHHVTLLVLLETMESIVRRQKPTLKIQTRSCERVDRFLGLSFPLLSCYYDLCAISYSLVGVTNEVTRRKLHQQLDRVQVSIDAWQPDQPDNFINELTSAEVVHLLAQAKVYRLGALLMAHRLRFMFGQEDSQADIWSREIMVELELARQTTKQSTHFVTLPFIIAAVEVRDPALRIKVFQDVNEYVDQFTPIVQKATRTFLGRVWGERDARTTCSWLDSIHKPCVLIDSVKNAFSA
ncbi:hypothetical protein K431DRAFT_247944 [Polychaeton citri CBS 116435]|uniref:Zn(2)-C6 fungal-type domain-containing protein n=1 Tax=Polychaeton citri CBS 116435 TaxID=1314669 RepID=A0A9P4Q7J8_9PEZI|nr:hypothetical protein K431DRAFT_247944 [Polychaeton citri CBS 116435]